MDDVHTRRGIRAEFNELHLSERLRLVVLQCLREGLIALSTMSAVSARLRCRGWGAAGSRNGDTDVNQVFTLTAEMRERLLSEMERSTALVELVEKATLTDEGIRLSLNLSVLCSGPSDTTLRKVLRFARFVPLKVKRRGRILLREESNMKLIAVTAAAGFLIAVFLCPGSLHAQSAPNAKGSKVTLGMLAAELATLTQTVSTLQTTVQSLQNQLSSANAQNAFALGQFVTVDKTNTINGLAAPHIIFTGANLHVLSGSGHTSDSTPLGNLVIGYDFDSSSIMGCGDSVSNIDANRNGSHNLIIGDCHEFTGSGGFVAGFSNRITNDSVSVSGGRYNDANKIFSSVSGGACNTAGSAPTPTCDSAFLGEASSVTGGVGNIASGTWHWFSLADGVVIIK